MNKFALTIKLLYRILAIGLLCLVADSGEIAAAEASVKVIQNGLSKGNLMMKFKAEDLFSEKVIRFLNRGFTIRVEYSIELWESRSYWFDSFHSRQNIGYQIVFEPLEKRYLCKKVQNEVAIKTKVESELDEITQWVMNPDSPMIIITSGQLDPKAKYYYNIEIVIATLTAENVRDLQKWLGEFSEEGDEKSSLAKTSFRVVRDFLSSRNHKKITIRSDQFYLYDLPNLEK